MPRWQRPGRCGCAIAAEEELRTGSWVTSDAPLAQQYGIRGIPSLLFFKNGEPVDMIVGAAAKESIQEKIDGLL